MIPENTKYQDTVIKLMQPVPFLNTGQIIIHILNFCCPA